MNTKKIFMVLLVLVLSLSMLLVGCGAPEPEPTEPVSQEGTDETVAEESVENVEIDIVVGFGAGGSNDLSARYLAQALSAHGIIANVINMPGGMGTEAGYHVSNQSADSNMFMWGSGMIMLFEPAAGDRGYTIHDFEPVATIAGPTFAIASKAGAPWETLDDLIEYIKDNPGEVVLGGQGEGNSMHFIVEMILDPNELDYTYVGLAGGADVALNLTGGHVDLGHLSLAAARPLHQDGDLTVLINTQALIERDPLMPEIPNVIEYGIDARERHSPLALFAPQGTSPELKERISNAMAEIAQDEDFIQSYQDLGVVAHYLNTDETWDFFMDIEENFIPAFVEWRAQF
ncbi:Uncharacterized protein UPF0065 [Alkaliphilus metalliredigens QYMF]|uniref:Uncharacterized protein UPF0065 n=1 Tax=Alkaliphilus metalliredigens (strain QYMF) TaxID=293826 RepID=A6TTX2_ALKMQ|nr:tripartite tricarboxylate transporter substrate binding protein [Alkaliphilus metalliredigens]ABR49640.1 Uncharacterized protein UPF0065 [Alkaliphilus metalliredigens QYMF]